MRLRELMGAALRRRRQAQSRTLRQVAAAAGMSVAYLSEVERGRKEPSSEMLEAVCAALGIDLSDVLFEVAEALAGVEAGALGVPAGGVPAGFAPRRVELPARTPPAASRPASARLLHLQAFAARRSA
ncbi:MAG TPA: helix-turn-helix transcriptional regulator [Actinomycetes bacterium]|nr:helix-turn-helix transcriptional regulator [Actinomycetes bacterium]